MIFRRLYWIAEQVDEAGKSRVTGVYTSIQDLVNHGLHWCEGEESCNLRLTIVKPDTFNKPLGSWTSPTFEGLAEDIKQFVSTQEYTDEETAMLQKALHTFVG